MNFARALNLLMESTNTTAYKLSKETGISQTMIGYYKTGKNSPTVDKADLIAKYFGVTTDYLLGAEKSPDAENGIEAQELEILEIAKRLSPEGYARLLDHARLLQSVEQSKAKNE